VTLAFLLPGLLAAAQTDRLPPANPLPPPGADEANVLAPVNAMLAALSARDAAALLAQVHPEGAATVAEERADGTRSVRRMGWQQFAAGVKPGPERIEERIYAPAVEVDGDVGMVWARYDFLIDGRVHHCGYDLFDMVRDGGRWRVLNVTWSSRTTGCTAK